ncbi:MAG: hypothetical protein WCQ50_12950, partial [Spirochaetota bacterium]
MAQGLPVAENQTHDTKETLRAQAPTWIRFLLQRIGALEGLLSSGSTVHLIASEGFPRVKKQAW